MIGDGPDKTQWRTGGLKMGGMTYCLEKLSQDPSSLTDRTSGFVILNCGQRMEIFSKQYVMERDTRAGPGHWKGCHTFTDMIGDGPDKLYIIIEQILFSLLALLSRMRACEPHIIPVSTTHPNDHYVPASSRPAHECVKCPYHFT
jgi:hypothetical protein